MSKQINLKFSNEVFLRVKKYSKDYGYASVQDFIRELVREKLFEKDSVSGYSTYFASEASLARLWNTKEEDEAWKDL